ncbi:MAG: pyridoxal phosphate-dependent aminotransferase [Deltaproteobacteria bacterium]|nr:pyridoxal phosphate-dependent aminotransferase [Deltaproteobacteria bacterium]
MPRFPSFSDNALAMPGAVYSPFADRLHEHPGPLYPLHVGDTWMEPFEGGRMEDLSVEQYPGMHRYCDTRGVPELVDAVVEKVRARNQLPCERENTLICAGATGALSCAAGAMLRPGDEVLILAPFWPLIRGIVQTFGGVPVEVPFYDRVDSVESAVEAVRERLSPTTVALYVSTPSNPTGRVIPESWLVGLAEFARAENLWLLSDEVYEDFIYRGLHFSIGRVAPERTITVYSFSKAFGMAGNRTGYLIGPREAADQARKLVTHTFYSAPTAGQLAGLRALESGASWVEHARETYCEVSQRAASVLNVPEPEGSTFFFLDVSSSLDERGIAGFLEDCFEDGVMVAPGQSSGRDYGSWVRLCYTAMPPDRVSEALALLAARIR